MLANDPTEPRLFRLASVSLTGQEFDPLAYVGE